MDDAIETIAEIYDAVGDADRWKRLRERLARTAMTPDIESHLEIASRAHEHHVRLTQDIAVLSTVHDQLGLGVIVVDREKRLLRANAAATRVLKAAVGLVLIDDRVQAVDRGEEATLRAAITGLADAKPRRAPFLLITRPGEPPLSVVVLHADHARHASLEDRPPVLLLVIDSSLTTTHSTQLLRTLFGFTAREAECAALLMQGRSLDEAARALGVRRSTVRTFLAHMTSKTDSHSQTQLMKQLLAIPSVR